MITELEAELRRLKRGSALAAADLEHVVGPSLKGLCGIVPGDSTGLLRSRLSELIRRHAAALPQDLRLAVLAALALHPEAPYRFLNERLRSLLPIYDRDAVRTIDRLVNKGLSRIAQSIQAEQSAADANANRYVPTGYYTESLVSTFRLDLAQPELRERRVVVATRDGVDSLLVPITVPRDRRRPEAPEVGMRVVEGGELMTWTRVTPGHFQGTIRLPRRLCVGERHHYEAVFEPSPRSSIQPFYLLTPFLRCDHLEVRVRFDPAEQPSAVWRLPGVPRAVVEDYGPPDERLSPDQDGWVTAVFHGLFSGLSYGVRWSFES